MRLTTSTRLTTACLLAGALACASNTARVDDETAAARDTTTTETPPGYSGMERDTTMSPDTAATAVDTFLEEQGTGVPADTQGYGGLEQVDTTGAAVQTDTSGYGEQPSGQTGYDTTGYGQQPGQTGETGGIDTTGQAGTGYGADTTSTGTGMDTTGIGTDTTGTWQQDSVSR